MTRYYVKVQPRDGRDAYCTAFDSDVARVIFILDHVASMVVLSTWTENVAEVA